MSLEVRFRMSCVLLQSSVGDSHIEAIPPDCHFTLTFEPEQPDQEDTRLPALLSTVLAAVVVY